jgi:hypothetical protein
MKMQHSRWPMRPTHEEKRRKKNTESERMETQDGRLTKVSKNNKEPPCTFALDDFDWLIRVSTHHFVLPTIESKRFNASSFSESDNGLDE